MAAKNRRSGRGMKVIVAMWQGIQGNLAWVAHYMHRGQEVIESKNS